MRKSGKVITLLLALAVGMTRKFDTRKSEKPYQALFFCQFCILCIAYMRILWYNILISHHLVEVQYYANNEG